MVQVRELFLKELGEGKQFRSKQDTGRHRGKLQKRKTDPLKLSLKLFFSQHLPLIHCQVTHIIPRDTLANGFCGESLTYDWSHDCLCRCPGCAGCSELTNVWHILECTQHKCWPLSYPSTSYPDSPKVRQERSDVTYTKKSEKYLVCAFCHSARSTTVLLKRPWFWLGLIQPRAENKSSVNICFVTWPLFTGNVSLNEA